MGNEISKQNITENAENTLRIVANIILIIGVLATIVLLFTIVVVKDPLHHYQKVFSSEGFSVTVGTFLTVLVTWALLRVIANISYRLKNIQDFLSQNIVTPTNRNEEIDNPSVKVQQPKSIGGTYLATETDEPKEDFDFSVSNAKVNTGDYIIYVKNNKKYKVLSTDGSKVCIQKSPFGAPAWIGPTEYRKE